MNTTAVVTGAAAGLGREISTELLARGRPVVLLDRDSETLDAVSSELMARYAGPVSSTLPTCQRWTASMRSRMNSPHDRI